MSTLYYDYQADEIAEFETAFKIDFGKHHNQTVYFGSSSKSADNQTTVCFAFTAPLNVEDDVSFNGGDSMNMGGDRIMVVADHPYALPDDGGVVGVRRYMQGHSEGRLSMFVNDPHTEDPNPPVVRDGSQSEPYIKPRTTGLKAGVKYFCHFYRTDIRDDGIHAALKVQYTGTSPADGEEIPLEDASESLPDDARGEVVTLEDGRKGIFFPL